jgi:hypothetical protein
MPLEPTSPEDRDVKVTQTKTITHYHVVNLNININPNDVNALFITVRWEEGYMDGQEFISVAAKDALFDGQDTIDKVMEITDGTTSVYDNVKQRVWEMLQTAGLVPAGTVT